MNVSYFEVNHLIKDAYGLLERCTQAGLEGLDLSVAQFQLLEAVASGRASSPAQCSRAINLTPSGMTHIIDKLAGRGLIARTREEDDRRFITIRLQPLGEALYQCAVQAVSNAWDAELQARDIKEFSWLGINAAACVPSSEKALP